MPLPHVFSLTCRNVPGRLKDINFQRKNLYLKHIQVPSDWLGPDQNVAITPVVLWADDDHKQACTWYTNHTCTALWLACASVNTYRDLQGTGCSHIHVWASKQQWLWIFNAEAKITKKMTLINQRTKWKTIDVKQILTHTQGNELSKNYDNNLPRISKDKCYYNLLTTFIISHISTNFH